MKLSIRSKQIFSLIVLAALAGWHIFWLARPINIVTGDLGRHLKNGELMAGSLSHWSLSHPILYSNFYSYTFPDFPFINHHWASGIIFYAALRSVGWTGLHLFFIFISSATLILFISVAMRGARLGIAAPIAFFLIPLVAERRDIRPEIFSSLFFGVFLAVLAKRGENTERWRLLLLLPPLTALWANLHIYFIFGIGLIGIFLLDEIIKKSDARRRLGAIFAACVLATLINPAGIKGSLYPLRITNDFGISVQETLSVSKASTADFASDRRVLYIASIALGAFIFAWLALRGRQKAPMPFFLLFLTMSFFSWIMIRNVSFFALSMIPILSIASERLIGGYSERTMRICALFLALLTIAATAKRMPEAAGKWGIGLPRESASAGEFLKANPLQGPLYNEFDGGGYAIFFLYPRLRPFVDNRPEAYPPPFLRDEYAPARLDENAWNSLNGKYGFNILLLSLQGSRASLPFAVRRLDDPQWSPVFVNNYHMIFARRTAKNAEIIQKFEIPRDRFSVVAE